MENDGDAPHAKKHRTARHIYKTAIGPVCMSEEEHDAYLEAKEEMEPESDEQDR